MAENASKIRFKGHFYREKNEECNMDMFKTAAPSQEDGDYLTFQSWLLADFCILILEK